MYNCYFSQYMGKGKENKQVVLGKELELQNWSSSDQPQTSQQQQTSQLSASGEVFPKPSIFSSDKGLWTTIRFLMFSFVHWGMAHTAFHSFFICFYSYKSHCVTVHQSPCQLLFMEKMKMILKSKIESVPFRGAFSTRRNLEE